MRVARTSSILALAVACALPALAQHYAGTAAAQAAVKAGDKANESGRYQAAIAAYQKAIQLDPDYAHAYEQLVFAQNSVLVMPLIKLEESGKKPTAAQNAKLKAATKALTKRQAAHYEALAKKHPDKAVYPWVLAQLYDEDNPLRERKYCEQSLKIDPKFAPGYQCLAAVAGLGGNDSQAAAYLRQAMQLEPKDASLAATYAFSQRAEPAAMKAAAMDMARKFPTSSESAEVLYAYAGGLRSDAAQLAALQQLRQLFPPAKFDSSNQGVMDMFGIYDRTDPAKALALARQMHKALPKDTDWKGFVVYADAMATATNDLRQHQPEAALAALKTVKSPAYGFDMRRQQILHARALDASGKTSAAYAALLGDYVKLPTSEIRTALNQYGAKLGKTPPQVDAAVWAGMRKNAKPAIPFSLPSFRTNKPVSLAGYKGQVVIVDFFFPNCGPCRQSFPYMQQIALRYKDKGVTVLAINGIEGQAPFVMPLMKNMGYDFIPLQGTSKWCSDVYHVNAFPSTFLIGRDGRLYFRPHVYDNLTQAEAEGEINELLAHKG